MPDFGIKKKAYRPRWQDTPGYKTVVDQDSQMGIFPEQTESDSVDRGQSNLDSMWPVQAPQSREKQRALPLPSNHDKKREKRIGPTTYNKPRRSPNRTLDVPGKDYGHPTKYDYNYVRRRQDVTALEEDEDEGEGDYEEALASLLEMLADAETEDIYEEDPIDDQQEVVGAGGSIFPKKRQKNQGAVGRIRSKRWYKRHPAKGRKERIKYRTRGKRLPRKKLKRKYRRMYPHRYKRRGIDPRTPAQKTKDWREEQKREGRDSGDRRAGMELLGEVLELLGFEMEGANWSSNWNTHVKKTQPPEQLDQNYGKGRSRDTGTPRKDPKKQKGESLRAPDLDRKPQKGLKWELEPPASGGLDYPQVTTMNPTDGSGKVLPMSYYTDIVNNTQAIPDGRQDRYLHNNNFEVKQATRTFIHELCHPGFGREVRGSSGPEGDHSRVAMTMGEILKRCDRKIKERAKNRPPKLSRIDTKNWIWHWKSGDHTVRVQAFKRGNAKNLPKLNLRISCSCPFWRWWGPEHWGTKGDYQKGALRGTGAYPKIRDPAKWRPVCKHAYAVLEKSKDFFVRPRKSPLKKLGSRFLVDSEHEIEIELVESHIAARVAQKHQERQISRRVLRRYLAKEENR